MLGLKKHIASTYDYIYMIIMVVYMAQMTRDTGRMVGNLSGNPVPFLIPIILTTIFAINHRVKFHNKNLFFIVLLFFVWTIVIVLKKSLYSTNELSFFFFVFYAIVVAYIHVQGYGKSFFPCFEEVMVMFCKITFVLWGLCNIFPEAASSIMHQFPKTGYGNHVWFIFNWMDPAKEQIYRNAGISWEPGRFAIMIILAIAINLSREGIKFKSNPNIIWLLLALASTFSTTGYITAIVLYTIYLMRRFNVKNISFFIMAIVPLTCIISTMDFIGEKLSNRLNIEDRIESIYTSVEYAELNAENDEYRVSLDRFESIYFEALYNIPNDPLFGYGRNTTHSYYGQNISRAFVLTGGLLAVISQLGIPLGLFMYLIMFNSSVAIAKDSLEKRRLAIFIAILMSSISYVLLFIPVFTTFWFYGIFKKESKI